MDLGEPIQDLTLADGWRLRLSESALELTQAGTTKSIVLPRDQVLEGIERWGLDFNPGHFVVRGPRKQKFKVTPYQAMLIKAWLGPDYRPELRHLVQQRLKSAIPLALMLALVAGSDVFTWIIAGLVLAAGILGRLRPTHYIFLIDGASALAVALRQAQRAFDGAGALAGGLALMVFVFGLLSLDLFRRFHAAFRAGVVPGPGRAGAGDQ